MRMMLRFWLQLFCIFGLLLPNNNIRAFSLDTTVMQEERGLQFQKSEVNIDLLNIYGGVIKDISVFGDYAFIAVGPRLIVMDITDPSDPQIVYKSEWLPDSINTLVANGNYVYVAAGVAGLLIFDISDPYDPYLCSSFTEGVKALDLALQGQYAYLSDTSGLYIIDISAPKSPALAGFFKPLVGGAFVKIVVSGDYLYGHDWGTFYIIDISNPSSPFEVSSVYNDGKLSYYSDLEVQGNYVYITDPGWSRIFVIDVNDPQNPIEYIYYPSNSSAGCLIVDGNYIYASQYNRILVIDNTDPENLIELGTIPLDESVGGFTSSGNLLFAYSVNSLHIWDKSDPLDLLEIADYQYNEKYTYGGLIEVEHSLAYIRADRELFVIDFSVPQFPQILGTYHLRYSPDIRIHGQRAYILDNPEEGQWDRKILEIVDLTDPRNPQLIGTYDGIDPAFNLYLADDNYVYLSGTYFGQEPSENVTIVELWDITTPAEIHKVSTYSTQGSGWLLAAADSYLYVFIHNTVDYLQDGLYIVDCSDLSDPQLLWIYHDPQEIGDIVVRSPYVYIFHGELMDIFDLSDPVNPVKVTTYSTAYIYDAEAWGDYLYVVTGYLHTLTVYDISNPVFPHEIGYFNLIGDYNTVHVSGKQVFIDNIADGMGVLWFAPPVTAQVSAAGGDLYSPMDNTHYSFPPGVFSETVTLTHTILKPINDFPPIDVAASIDHVFDLTVVDLNSGLPVQPSSFYTLTIDYLDTEIGPVDESSLSLYYKVGEEWVKEPSSLVDISQNRIITHPNHFSQWALLGETNEVFLPIALLHSQSP